MQATSPPPKSNDNSLIGNDEQLPWKGSNASFARQILKSAHQTNRPVVLLLGAGLSVDSGIPLASHLSQYLVQLSAMLRSQRFASARQYLEEMRWPSRHDMRIDLMLEFQKPSLREEMQVAERLISQAALISELRRASPTMAFALDEIFGQLRGDWKSPELKAQFEELAPLARNLAKRVPRNVAYRSLLFHLCENSQALIDGCLDHFIRDRAPTTTHQFITFLTQILRSRVILSTNFDPLLERAFAAEGTIPRVYEIQGEGSIPSANMLLSQQLSIVKLHGGAHQMRTGFDLDDPLSPTALGSFYELFDRLQGDYNQQPLILVMGYSGSDRRVMDIVGTHIKRWKRLHQIKSSRKIEPVESDMDFPCVLWITRDKWAPELLKSAVDTHPHVLFRTPRTSQDQATSNTEKEHRSYPVHLVRYQEGRLFLLEVYQDLASAFPISKSHYQAVNFVPHASPRNENIIAACDLTKPDNHWQLSLIIAERGGGSSSQLAKLADDLDNDYRVIWIDMAEVPSVSALLDVLSERICKYDYRLQPLRRPILLQSTLCCPDGKFCKADGVFKDNELKGVEDWEVLVATRWIQHALRRGQYLIAFDSMDEFPGDHPALFDQMTTWGSATQNSNPSTMHVIKERYLLRSVIEKLMADPNTLGDSRIAIAMAKVDQNCKEDEKCYLHLQEQFRRRTGSDQKIYLIELPGKPASPKEKSLKGELEGIPATEKDFGGKHQTEIAKALILSISSCARRIRSELLLSKTCMRMLWALTRQEEVQLPKLLASLFMPTAQGNAHESMRDGLKLMTDLLWHSRDKHSSRAAGGLSVVEGVDERAVVVLIRTIAGECGIDQALIETQGEMPGTNEKSKIRWFHRVEGGYHWMHRTIRDKKYTEMRRNNPLLVSLLHHRIAEFCHDDLYYRSNDARAFLEYLFHRTASIRVLVAAPKHFQLSVREGANGKNNINYTLAAEWIERLGRTLQREKSSLLTRARIPTLITQLRVLLKVCIEDCSRIEDEALKKRIRNTTADILGVLGDLLVAAGHPHSAVQCHAGRLKILINQDLPTFSMGEFMEYQLPQNMRDLTFKDIPFHIKNVSDAPNGLDSEERKQSTTIIAALSDLVNALQDPMMFDHNSIPTELNSKYPSLSWCEHAFSSTEHKSPSRKERSLWIESQHTLLQTLWQKVFTDIRHGKTRARLEEDLDLSRTLFKRYLEYRLLKYGAHTIKTIKLYGGAPLQKAPIVELEQYEDFEHHIWRVTPRSSRHECYRLCLRARMLAVADNADWNLIWSLFQEAEAALDRQGEPADLQALAITRLLHAEHRLRRAELITLENITDLNSGKKCAKLKAEASRLHEDAGQLLVSIEALLSEGRGENRWRFFHLLTQARWRMFRALDSRDTSPVKSMEDSFWAGRFLVCALSNCGKWTDRRYVLTLWWKAFESSIIGNDDDLRRRQNWARMKSRLGVDWNLSWRNKLEKNDPPLRSKRKIKIEK